MYKIKPVVFTITKEEIEYLYAELVESEILNIDIKLTISQIKNVLTCVECDEFLAKDIRSAIKEAIIYCLD